MCCTNSSHWHCHSGARGVTVMSSHFFLSHPDTPGSASTCISVPPSSTSDVLSQQMKLKFRICYQWDSDKICRCAEKGLGNGFYRVLKTWAAFKKALSQAVFSFNFNLRLKFLPSKSALNINFLTFI